MSRMLDVYLHDRLVGILEQPDSGGLIFTYDTDYVSGASYAISLSLPLQSESFKGDKVKAFFSGLLPDESVRDRLARSLGVSKENSFGLLEEVGGDCAGALALYPHGEKPPKTSPDIEVLDDKRLKEILDLIKHRPMLAGDDGYRLSLAGAQDKLAAGFRDGRVVLIKGGAPTTHILKPMIEHVQDSAHNELFCMKLASMVGIDAPEASLHFVDDTPYYLVERYDRHIAEDGTVERIHQEDFCQALGIPPEIKYEIEGGPGIADCQDMIIDYTARPATDLTKLRDMVLFNYLIGNADAHGKNFSLLYKGNKPELAPAYDILSTAIYPELTEELSMKIGGEYESKNISLRHFYGLVADTKAAQSAMSRQVKTMTEKMLDSAPSLKANLTTNEMASDVFDKIIATIEERALRLSES